MKVQGTPEVTSKSIDPDEFLTTSELMSMLKIKHKQTIYGLIKEGLPHLQVGNKYRFIKNEVVEHLRQKTDNK